MTRMIALAATAALLATPALACDDLAVQDAYARASTPMSTSGAAFMRLVNSGDAECHITGVRSDAARRTEMHTHIQDDNGVMRMRQLEDGFRVPAGGAHALQRGGDHVMFMGLNAPFVQGNMLNVVFVFEDGSEHAFEVPVDLHRTPNQMPQD